MNICFEKIEVGVIMASMNAIHDGDGRGSRPCTGSAGSLSRFGGEVCKAGKREGLFGLLPRRGFGCLAFDLTVARMELARDRINAPG
jgi:ribosomal protein L15